MSNRAAQRPVVLDELAVTTEENRFLPGSLGEVLGDDLCISGRQIGSGKPSGRITGLFVDDGRDVKPSTQRLHEVAMPRLNAG